MIKSNLSGETILQLWIAGIVVAGIMAGVLTGWFKARKIQPKGFRWRVFAAEIGFASFNLAVTACTLQPLNQWLQAKGVISFKTEVAPWWVIALEFALYFALFDTWFYWLHRWMHKEPIYTWVHKIHHRSTSPNLLTTLSVNPLESLINGGFVPLFLALFTVHEAAVALIVPTNIVMGLYVHSGYEFLPRWWNRSWATKWLISATFHDQHHKYFNWNFGGYTTVWDRLCGTMRCKFEADFDQIKMRNAASQSPLATPDPVA